MKEFSRNKLILLFVKQEGKCAYCKCSIAEDCQKGKTPHIDHIIPKKNGGRTTADNTCLSCGFCNIVKGARPVEYLMQYLSPFLLGKCSREELRDYHKWELLNNKFKK